MFERRASRHHGTRLYICPAAINNCIIAMSDHHVEGHFPEEAEQNEIGGPVLFALVCLGASILIIWAMS